MPSQNVLALATTIWTYHHLNQPLQRSDILLVLGGHDLRVPEYAATLYQQGLAPLVVISGGIAHTGDMLSTGWKETEAEKFAEVMINAGVPKAQIILEQAATNTGENFSFSRKLLNERDIAFSSALVVTKPYMERRSFATGAKQWPDIALTVSSPQMSFETYCEGFIPEDDVINIMMGDLERISVYGKNGFQIPQEIPEDVWTAFEALKALGYTKHLLKET